MRDRVNRVARREVGRGNKENAERNAYDSHEAEEEFEEAAIEHESYYTPPKAP